MFGFLIGFACLVGLMAVLRGGRRCGRGWHGGGWRRRGHHRHGGSRHFLGYFFDRLDTTPGQEKEIRAAVEDLMDKGAELRRESRATRGDVAKLLRTESLDENILGELFARHDERLRELQKAFADALGRVHQTLDPEQRARLANFLAREDERGYGGPYRGWV